MEQIPRRIRVDLMTPAELAIRQAVLVVEEAGCDSRLTDAVVLLGQAKECVADYVDNMPRLVKVCPSCASFEEERDMAHEAANDALDKYKLAVNDAGAALMTLSVTEIELTRITKERDEARQLAAELALRLLHLRRDWAGGQAVDELLARSDVQALLGTEPPKLSECAYCGGGGGLVSNVDGPLMGKCPKCNPEPQPAPSPWIPVSERLPEEFRSVLVVLAGGNRSAEGWFRYKKGEASWNVASCTKVSVTHWMPLPSPPRSHGCSVSQVLM